MSNKPLPSPEECAAAERDAFDQMAWQLDRAKHCTDLTMQAQYATTAARLAEAFAALRGARRAP